MKHLYTFENYSTEEISQIKNRNVELFKSKLPALDIIFNGKDKRTFEPDVRLVKNNMDNDYLTIDYAEYIVIKIYDGKIKLDKKSFITISTDQGHVLKKALKDISNYIHFNIEDFDLKSLIS